MIFYEPLKALANYEEVNRKLKAKTGQLVQVTGCIDTQKMHIASALAMDSDSNITVIISSDEIKAKEMCEDLSMFSDNVVYYPVKDTIFYNADSHGAELIKERIACIRKIVEAYDNNEKLCIVTLIDALSDTLVPIERYIDNTHILKQGEDLDLEKLSSDLVQLGFERVSMIEQQGQFSIRGGIVDIYGFSDESPVRIELWDTEIDSIRFFDIQSQRSIENVKEYTIFPATECLLTEDEIDKGLELISRESEEMLEKFGVNDKRRSKESIEACNHLRRIVADAERSADYERFLPAFIEERSNFAEYFSKENTLFVLDEPNRLQEKMDFVNQEYAESMDNRLKSGYVLPCETTRIVDYEACLLRIAGFNRCGLTTLDAKQNFLKADYTIHANASHISSYNNSFEYLVKDIKKYQKHDYKLLLVVSSRSRAKRITEDLMGLGCNAYYTEDYTNNLDSKLVYVTYGNIHRGFEYASLKFALITENDIFTARKKKKRMRHKEYDGKAIASFNELNVGDFVVHENHGLGVYKGIEKIKVDGVEKDYIKLEYADNSSLYILATQLDRLQKYASNESEKKPKLSKLSGIEWKKTRAKVSSAVEEVARDLVELYAIRQKKKGIQFSPDTVWQTEFEEMFPYEETYDQLAAIEDTKRDMESDHVMDRLICGDVGYGKTEIAIRAAFKAVQDGYQVALLVPTTILASQHYATFEQRMKDFPVVIEQLSSFKSAKQNKETIEKLRKGLVDIVIGTHRLLSKDVEFKKLGLLIVDEEQRFGVTHKEKLKKLQNDVDVLTLSATPIPRTLHMSLAGIRDMSVLEEPPIDRVPIQTFVTEHNDEMIREAIKREIARDGQVYYVYNKVNTIADMAAHIESLVPEANVAFAHGQMEKRELERIMYAFINKDIDVLVSTTIIETGMDISNCNTMIIEDADKFGLSQLYQLRGRVGRSRRVAYAFLLYRRDKLISEVAEKRLGAIKEFSDFGSGFKIAMKDLEIRGAGNVLGKSQHGHMAAVGYDLYCKMLNEAVNTLKGIKNEYEFETLVEIAIDAFIPSTYIRSEYEKLDIYKRIAALENMEELSDMRDELIDRYGKLPPSAENLLYIAVIKALTHKIGAVNIKGGKDNSNGNPTWFTILALSPKAELKAEDIDAFLKANSGRVNFESYNELCKAPAFTWRVTRKKYVTDMDYLKGLYELSSLMCEYLL